MTSLSLFHKKLDQLRKFQRLPLRSFCGCKSLHMQSQVCFATNNNNPKITIGINAIAA